MRKFLNDEREADAGYSSLENAEATDNEMKLSIIDGKVQLYIRANSDVPKRVEIYATLDKNDCRRLIHKISTAIEIFDLCNGYVNPKDMPVEIEKKYGKLMAKFGRIKK